MTLIYGDDVLEWAANVLFDTDASFFGKATAIGMKIDDKIACACVYNNFLLNTDSTPLSLEMSFACVDKRGMSKYYIKQCFVYPFIQLGLERVQLHTDISAQGVNSFVSRLGFQKEGVLRSFWAKNKDAIIWSMLKDECKWL